MSKLIEKIIDTLGLVKRSEYESLKAYTDRLGIRISGLEKTIKGLRSKY